MDGIVYFRYDTMNDLFLITRDIIHGRSTAPRGARGLFSGHLALLSWAWVHSNVPSNLNETAGSAPGGSCLSSPARIAAPPLVDSVGEVVATILSVDCCGVDCCGDPVYNVISSGNGTTCRRCVRSKSSSECVFLLPLVLPNSFVRNSFKKYAAMLFLFDRVPILRPPITYSIHVF